MSLQQLRGKLGKGLYVDNLYEMARICKDMALESDNPAPFFIMQKIFLGVANYRDEAPINVEEAKLVDIELENQLKQLVSAVETSASIEDIIRLANKAISTYLFYF